MSLSHPKRPEPHGTKRKRDAPSTRRRSSLACDICRKQKEKCEGGLPCWRCQRLGRDCRFPDQATGRATFPAPMDSESLPPEAGYEHVQNLNQIVRHFLGDVSLDEENVARLAAKYTSVNTETENLMDVNESFDVHFVSRSVAFYSGEFSHWNFAEKLRRTTNSHRNMPNLGVKEYWRPTHLQSSTHVIAEVIAQLPPRSIADFLIDAFFKYAEVNAFYMEKRWIQEKVRLCYRATTAYTASDTPWLCSLFAVLAIGAQMAHMEDDQSSPESSATDEATVCSEDSVGLGFYHVACKLVPDAILVASHESVQAFLLLATYALPVSTGGLSYTYFGLAMKMAIQNGMHRKYVGGNCDGRTIELRNRLFWTTYTLEKYFQLPTLVVSNADLAIRRTSIMHGRPSSIARSEISADLPIDDSTFESPNFANMTALINLVSWMGEVAETLYVKLSRWKSQQSDNGKIRAQFKRCPKRLLPEYSKRLLQLRARIKAWWCSLPDAIECRDTNPRRSLFRQNSHLRLCYLLIYIYMGRPFIFRSTGGDGPDQQHRSELVKDCVDSALEILSTLKSLADNRGLCRASYTEFSSCRAALLVILAECLNSGKSQRLQDGLNSGMALIRQMIGGTSSESEISYIESIEAAIRQLSSNEERDSAFEVNSPVVASAYAKFKDWTQSMKKDKNAGNILELSSFSPMSGITPGTENMFGSELNELSDLLNPEWSTCDLRLDSDDFLAPK